MRKARRIALVGNRWTTDGRSGGTNLAIEPGVRDVLVAANRISQRASVRGPNAINFNSTNTRPAIVAVTIRDNRIGPVAGGGDAIQAKHTRGLTISHNEIFGVRRPPGSAAHPDVFQSIYGATGLTIKDNFIHNIAAQGIFLQRFKGTNRNFNAHDNVIARVAAWTAFSANARKATISHNTIDGILRAEAPQSGSCPTWRSGRHRRAGGRRHPGALQPRVAVHAQAGRRLDHGRADLLATPARTTFG